MNRRGFMGRLLAACGVGALPSVGASGVIPPATDRGVTPPPAPPLVTDPAVVRHYTRIAIENISPMSTAMWDELAQMQEMKNRELAHQLYGLKP